MDEIRINGNFRNVPLASFFDTLEARYPVKVYYKRAWVTPYYLNTSFVDNPLERALNSIFLNHDLTFDIIQDNSIIIFPRRLDTRSNFEGVDQTLVIGDPVNKGRYKSAEIT
ncbi:MAG TPA: DUF4974 domain-containing protein, partial [Draconibacterium sp.]|nr:DUF4974 domain-containing protein [Draconibacterium sp.]